MTDHAIETTGHLFPSEEKESLTVMVDHLEDLPHVKDRGLRIMTAFPHVLNLHLSAVVDHHLHLHLEEWMIVQGMADMMITTCENATGMNHLTTESLTQDTHSITEVNRLTEIGVIRMILQGDPTQKEETTTMIAMIHTAVISLGLMITQALPRGREWITMIAQMTCILAARQLRHQLTV